MAAIIGSGVTLRGLYSNDFMYTWALTGTNGVSPGIPCPMMQDTGANDSAKVAIDGAVLLGSLATFENRVQEGVVVGTISHKGNFTWTYTGAAPVRGNSVVGSATPGAVKDSGAAAIGIFNRVVEVDTVALIVTVMFG